MLIAATHAWNPAHRVARSAVEAARCAVDHAVVEAYSVLTRMPEPGRLEPNMAAEAIEDAVTKVISLPLASRLTLARTLAGYGVSGGASHDGLIALTAAHHDATLLTLDARAVPTYRACGVTFELLHG